MQPAKTPIQTYTSFFVHISDERFSCALTAAELIVAAEYCRVSSLNPDITNETYATVQQVIADILRRAEENGISEEEIDSYKSQIKCRTGNTVEWMCREDNPDEYHRIIGAELWDIVSNFRMYRGRNGSASFTVTGITSIIYVLYRMFLVKNPIGKDWWYFSQSLNRWIPMIRDDLVRIIRDSPSIINNLLLISRADNIAFVQNRHNNRKAADDVVPGTEEFREMEEQEENNLGPIMEDIFDVTAGNEELIDIVMQSFTRAYEASCANNSTMRNASEYLPTYFSSGTIANEFNKRVDLDPHVTNLKNVVAARSGNRLVMRPGKPEDFITRSTRVPYLANKFNWEHPDVKKTLYIFRQITKDDEHAEYLWRIMSSGLAGYNCSRSFLIFDGIGANGKSTIISFLDEVFGDYVCKWEASAIMGQNNNPGSANPNLTMAKGSRWAITQESNHADVLNSGTIKLITGSDSIAPRELFGRGSETFTWTPNFVPILVTNTPPKITDTQQAIFDRLQLLSFHSIFYADQDADMVPSTREEQDNKRIYLRDAEFNKTISKLAEAFLWICVQYFKNLAENNYQYRPPMAVIERVQHYRTTQNSVMNFIMDRYEVEKRTVAVNSIEDVAATTSIEIRTLWDEYSVWAAAQNLSSTHTMPTFISAMHSGFPLNMFQRRGFTTQFCGIKPRLAGSHEDDVRIIAIPAVPMTYENPEFCRYSV